MVGEPSEGIELISQTKQWDLDALFQTTNPIPETLHNAQWTSIKPSCSTMRHTNSYLPHLRPIVSMEVKSLPMPNPYLKTSSIKGCARKTGSKTMVTNARWMGAPTAAKLLVSITIPTPIYLLTHCHLSLSTYGGRKCADLQPWHFVTVGHKGGQQQEIKPHAV